MRIFNILIMFLLYTHSKETGLQDTEEIEGKKDSLLVQVTEGC